MRTKRGNSMRTERNPSMHRTSVLVLALAAPLAGACNWAAFDDLEDDAWAGSTEKPDGVESSDYGVAIQRGARSGEGGTLAVIGAGQATYSQLVYDGTGAARLAASKLELNSQYGIGTLDPQPILLADPDSDDVSLILNSGANSIAVLTGGAQIDLHQVFLTPSSVDAATYMQPPNRAETPTVAEPTQPLIASGEVVAGAYFANVPNPQPRCRLTDAGMAIQPRALGVVRNGAFDDVLAWGANGKLYRYPSSVFHGCGANQEPTRATAQPIFVPGRGSQILTVDGPIVLLQGHRDGSEDGFLQVYNGMTLENVGGEVSLPRLRSAAILDVNGTKYVIAGYPGAQVDNKSAGQVLLFRISSTAGIEATPAATLHDAQPENNQSFGRAVAAMPFNGKQVIAVAADNEIFVYFRANLTSGMVLYDETRLGR
jgi:hypothetical protein